MEGHGHRKFLRGGGLKVKILKHSRRLNWNFLGVGGGGGGGEVQNKKPSMGGVWIFSGVAQYSKVFFMMS